MNFLQKQLYYPYSEALMGAEVLCNSKALAEAIKNAPSLRELEMAFGYSFPKQLFVMAQNPHLRVIRVYRKRIHAGVTFSFERVVENDSRLRELVVFVIM